MINHPTLILILLILMTACVGKHSSEKEVVKANTKQATVISDHATKVPINLEKSVIHWRGTKMQGMGKHEGDLKLQEGQLFVKNDQLVGGYFITDMQSITVTDIPEHKPIPRNRLTNHLKEKDFFAVDQYPTARFDITKVETLPKDSLRITGNLTIKNITKSIVFTALHYTKSQDFTTTFAFNRFDWNISFQGNLVNKLIVDPAVELRIELRTR